MQDADHILIPLLDGRFALAQVSRIEQGQALLLITGMTRSPTAKVSPLQASDIIASAVVAPSTLTPDQWAISGYTAVPRIATIQDITLPSDTPTDPALIEAFINAIHGLYPWDGFPDKDMFTNMLRAPDTLPAQARMTADFPKPDVTP